MDATPDRSAIVRRRRLKIGDCAVRAIDPVATPDIR